MEKHSYSVSVFKYRSNDSPFLAGFKECLVFDNSFDIYSLASFYSFRVAGCSFHFVKYYFSNYSDNDNFGDKIYSVVF